ncbi:MAG: alpha/beta hydrolase-fold protein [Pseudomonadota bacterium]|nr:alpha/beta hydrolase-fold protein [Pseudomonadota bacterium]
MELRRLLAAFALAGWLSASAFAQNLELTDAGPLSIGTTLTLQSAALNETRTVHVALPPDYATSTQRYPVVYVLDAQTFWLFQYAYGETSALAGQDRMPPVILVGVTSPDRFGDLTVASPTNARGRAVEFRSFLGDELQPLIDSRYRTAPYTVLIGHSLGGSFALHTLARAPDTFDAYIAMSPALQVYDGAIFREVTEGLGSGRTFKNTLFTSLADEDADMLRYYDDFVQLMADTVPEGIDFRQMRFPDESHGSTPMPGMHHGLLAVWQGWVPPDSITTFDAMLSYFDKLSEHYGYTVTMTNEKASRLGLDLYDAGDAAGALQIFEYSLANIAQGPIEYHQMGLALRELGRFEEALAAFENAIARGPESRFYPMFVEDRDAVAARIAEQTAAVQE